ncbi:hypothetical protein AB0D38_20735 [Streptomyces sp. NPDC048279]|uniref:anti-sigma factor family protein n=1 Tax=Streptomyces sp. NPDC048279 TaxID=3154714 RepID=UPI003419C44D
MDCEQIITDLVADLLESLDETASVELSRHLQGCVGCRAEYEETVGVLRFLAAADFGRPMPPTALDPGRAIAAALRVTPVQMGGTAPQPSAGTMSKNSGPVCPVPDS